MPTVDEWITKWLEEIASKKVNPKTIQSYRSALKKHVSDRYGGKKLHYLSPARIRELTATPAEEKSPGTARNVHSYLSHCLADAVDDGLLVEHPMKHLAIPQRPRKAENALSVDNAVHLLKWLGRQIDQQAEHAHLAPLWVAYLLTGARRGALLGLEPDRVGEDTMDVTWQLQRLGADDLASASADYEHRHLQDSYYLVRPKSQSGWRTYPLVEPLRSLVKGVADRTPDGQLVFSSPDGAPLDSDSITRRWKKMLIAAGVETAETPAKDRVKLHGARPHSGRPARPPRRAGARDGRPVGTQHAADDAGVQDSPVPADPERDAVHRAPGADREEAGERRPAPLPRGPDGVITSSRFPAATGPAVTTCV